MKTYRSGREDLRIDDELYAAIKQTGARSGGTLFATLLAAYEALCLPPLRPVGFRRGHSFRGAASARERHARRPLRQHRSVASALDPAAPFTEHLRTVRDELAQAQDHSRHTFGSLVRRLQLPRDPSRTPLVGMTFSIDKVGAPFDFGDVTIASLSTPKSYSNFELQVNVVDSGSDLLLECDYNADLFDERTIRRWLSHYETCSVASWPTGSLRRALALLGAGMEWARGWAQVGRCCWRSDGSESSLRRQRAPASPALPAHPPRATAVRDGVARLGHDATQKVLVVGEPASDRGAREEIAL